MTRRALACGWLVFLPVSLALSAAKTAEIDLKIEVSVPQPAVAAGSEAEAVMTLTPPSGIHLNKYPPIRLTLEQSPPVTFHETSVKVGLDAMPENPDENPFEKIDPIRLRFRVSDHASDARVPIKGKLKFFYCVAKSGYCAPGTKDVSFSVPITAGR